MKRILLLAATLSLSSFAADLAITVKGVHGADGSVFLAVYDSAASFMKPALAKATRKAAAAKGDIEFVIHDLPAGKYAVSSYHDENGNGKLDTGAFGIPTEGYGFSNNAQGSLGPPEFAQAVFEFDGRTAKSISFSLNY